MTAPDLTVRDIAQMLAGHALDICRELLPDGKLERGEWRAASVAGGRGRSLRVKLTGTRAGQWSDYATGEWGDLIDLYRLQRGVSLAQSIRWAIGYLRLTPRVPAIPRPSEGDRQEAAHPVARRIWRQSRAIVGTPAEAYLRTRGIAIPMPPDLRYHPKLYHRSGDRLPAMVAAVRTADGRMVAVHRTYLQSDGSGKAEIEPAKASLGPIFGGAVRLTAPGEVLGLAEGIESSLSALQLAAAGRLPGAPRNLAVWACLSAGGLQAVAIPPAVRDIVILADHDEAGLRAAANAGRRFEGEGRSVRVLLPPWQMDFNDLLTHR